MSGLVVATRDGLYSVGSSAELLSFEGRDVVALSPDGRWAIVDRREVWKKDGSWEKAATGDLDLNCVLESNGRVYAGAESAHLVTLRDGSLQVVAGFEEVEGRDEWFTPWGGPPDVRSLAASPSGDLYVNVHVGGIVKGDGEQMWDPIIDISVDVHEVRCHDRLIVAACAIGLAESGDGGYAWNYDHEGLHERYARAIAVGDDFAYMTVARGPRGGDAAVYRQPCDGSTAFERCDLPSFPDNIDTGCLDARGAEVAFGTSQGEVYRSGDGGESWSLLTDALPPVQHVVLTD